jgi:hypothetical protein
MFDVVVGARVDRTRQVAIQQIVVLLDKAFDAI